MQVLRGFIHLMVEQPTRKIVTPKHVWHGKKSFSFKIKQTPWIMNNYLFLLVFDAVDIFKVILAHFLSFGCSLNCNACFTHVTCNT